MNTIEKQLKDLILNKYKSMQSFSDATEINYQTLVSIFNRGIHKASIKNIIKMCKELGISADELANNKIVYVEKQEPQSEDVTDLINRIKQSIHAYKTLTYEGKPMTNSEIDMFIDGLDLSIEIMKKQRERENR